MFYYSHVDEQLFSCELLSIFQLKGSFVSLGDFSSNNPVWRHPRSSAASSALGWRGAGSGNAAARRWSRLAPQHGTGSISLPGSGEKARALTGLLSLMEQMWQLLCATTTACLRSGQRTPRAVPRAGTWGLSFSSRALEEELIVPARN